MLKVQVQLQVLRTLMLKGTVRLFFQNTLMLILWVLMVKHCFLLLGI